MFFEFSSKGEKVLDKQFGKNGESVKRIGIKIWKLILHY